MINTENSKYLQENIQLANTFLEQQFFSHYRKGAKKIEFFMTGICSANCEYCYLKKHQADLYPKEIHNIDSILINLQKVLNWYIEQKFCCDIDLFSANWINTPIGEQIFNIIYQSFSQVPAKYRPKLIGIPDNMQFLKDEKATEMVEKNICRFEELGIRIAFSASIDGYYCDEGRTKNSDEFYIKLKNFLVKYGYHVHPMISSTNISKQIQNHQWWIQNFPKEITHNIMTLETRDNTWSEENIQDLIQYCDYLIDVKLKDYNNNLIDLIDYIFYFNQKDNSPYNIIGLRLEEALLGASRIPCSNSQNGLAIRLGDLSIAPCHRLYYPEMLFGYFNSNDNTLLEFIPTNISWLIAARTINKRSMPYCESCEFEPMCIGFCQGASFEICGNPWVPPKEVCKMYKAKYSFIIYKLYTLGMYQKEYLDHIKEKFTSIEIYNYFIDISKQILLNQNIEILVEEE